MARPADAITFDAVITDDGTPEGNQFGHVLTARALNIAGGTAPDEYEYPVEMPVAVTEASGD